MAWIRLSVNPGLFYLKRLFYRPAAFGQDFFKTGNAITVCAKK
jgi:hypothetical protein